MLQKHKKNIQKVCEAPMLQKHKKSIQKVCEAPMICFSFNPCNKSSDDFSKFPE